MQKRWKTFLRNQNKCLLLLLLMPSLALAANGVMPIDKTKIQLSGGRTVVTKRTGDHSHLILLEKDGVVLWKKEYEQEYNRLWDYAFFVPVKKKHYSLDINHDGYPEIAIATWDGGNNIADRTALIFTVKPNSLEFFTIRKFNLEYGESAYP
jgi:hypothetical protein